MAKRKVVMEGPQKGSEIYSRFWIVGDEDQVLGIDRLVADDETKDLYLVSYDDTVVFWTKATAKAYAELATATFEHPFCYYEATITWR